MPSPLAAFDARAFHAVYSGADGPLATLATLLSAVGGGWAAVAILPLFALQRWRRFATALTAAITASALTVSLLKRLVDRRRPWIELPGVRALSEAPTDPSFPSGHACGSFTVAAFLVVVLCGSGAGAKGRAARVAGSAAIVTIAAGVAWSRVYLGVHFPGDVLGGASLGVVSGVVAAWLHVRREGAMGG